MDFQLQALEIYQSNCLAFSCTCTFSGPRSRISATAKVWASPKTLCVRQVTVWNVPNSQENPAGSQGAQKLRCAKQEAVIGRPGDSTRQKHQTTSLNDSTRNVHQTAMVDERLRFSSAEPSGFPVGIKPNERDTNFHFPFHLHSTVFTVEVPARCTKPYLPSPHVG